MKETDIRPADTAPGQHVAMLQDVGRLLTRRDRFVEVDCPACGSADRRLRFRKYGLAYAECVRCRTWYVNPRPSPETLGWFYRGSVNYAYWHEHVFPRSNDARRREIVAPRVDRFLDVCRRHEVTGGACLEIGSAYGTFLEELASRRVFDRLVGIEPTPDLAAHGRSLGVEIIEQRFEDVAVAPEARFDAVVFFEVIEHVFSPRAFLDRCRAVLKPGGVAALTCPNAHGFDLLTLEAASDAVDVEHLNYFNPESMEILLRDSGFDLLELSTPGELDAELVRKKVIEGEVSVDAQPFVRQVLVERWEEVGLAFQEFLKHNRLSSHLWVAARARK